MYIWIYICTISAFFDITKIADSPWENADVSRAQRVYSVIGMFFRSSLGKV